MRAYVDIQGPRVNIYVETPKRSWIRIADYYREVSNAEAWIEYMGYELITKAQSYDQEPFEETDYANLY